MAEKVWTKRRVVTITCPSGVECDVRRPGPEFGLEAGRLMRVLRRVFPQGQGEEVQLEQTMLAFEKLSDEEMAQFLVFARKVVIGTMVRPRLVAKPSPGIEDEIGPDDLPWTDFLYILNWAMSGGPTIPVQTKEGETTVAAVETFPEPPGPSADAVSDSGTVPPVAVAADGNLGSDDRPRV